MSTFRHFEDFTVGQRFDLGEKHVTAEEIIAFAREFDPQPFHLSEEAGKQSMLGGLAASGWHTIAMLMRQLCDGLLLASSCVGSPGVDKVRWISPVRPGDRLKMSAEVIDTRILKSRPGLGIVRFVFTIARADDTQVMTQENAIMFGCRETAA
ncbi:MaoC family dehydratase [Stappia sp. F7233]|uniref:MaoC family dehydratase n=1 Tax=Stappia albiluteola TaxID=2758565 RepID=A0A839A9E0_9HYPH|nr:MaoC family dehydratase [Stappia albiluteola]MBA5775745.1 MaoC family dehydratase [Stappia albiluteola]